MRYVGVLKIGDLKMKKTAGDRLGFCCFFAGIVLAGGEPVETAPLWAILLQGLVGIGLAWTGVAILRDGEYKYRRSISAFRYRGSR